jgi:hypothetical protein
MIRSRMEEQKQDASGDSTREDKPRSTCGSRSTIGRGHSNLVPPVLAPRHRIGVERQHWMTEPDVASRSPVSRWPSS